jgi:hypothetical protein
MSGAAFINLSHNFAYNRRIRARIANGEIAPDDWRPKYRNLNAKKNEIIILLLVMRRLFHLVAVFYESSIIGL